MPSSFRGLMALLLFVGASGWHGLPAARGATPPECVDCRFNFGSVARGTVIEHPFVLRNDGDLPLRIAGVQLSPPLKLARMPAVVPPKGSATLLLSLDTSNLEGEYQGRLVVMLSESLAAPRTFSMTGQVSPAIEVLPRPAFFLSTQKGVARSGSLEIVNHQTGPLTLKLRPRPSNRHRIKLEPIEAGKRYRLTLSIPADALAGRISERLELETSSPTQPILYIGVNSTVRDRVYTFPDSVDFGKLTLRELKSATAGQSGAVQTLMIYQAGGNKFEVQPRSSSSAIGVGSEPGPKRDRAQITVSLIPSTIKTGPIRATITLKTNDPDFPTLSVPVTGEVVAD